MAEDLNTQSPAVKQVPAANAWLWIVNGISLFRANPVMWVILLLIYLAIMIPISMVPILGSVVSTLLAPVFAAGMMWGCQALTRNQDLEINHLFQGFKQNTSQLVAVGGFYMMSLLVIAVLVVLMLDRSAVELIAQGKDLSPEQASTVILPLFIAMCLLMPVLMGYWFAPVLAGLNQLKAVDAMKLSFVACLKNILPFLLYGLMFMAVLMAAMWLVVSVHVIFSVVFVAIIPVMMTSLYTSYADIFGIDNANQSSQPDQVS